MHPLSCRLHDIGSEFEGRLHRASLSRRQRAFVDHGEKAVDGSCDSQPGDRARLEVITNRRVESALQNLHWRQVGKVTLVEREDDGNIIEPSVRVFELGPDTRKLHHTSEVSPRFNDEENSGCTPKGPSAVLSISVPDFLRQPLTLRLSEPGEHTWSPIAELSFELPSSPRDASRAERA